MLYRNARESSERIAAQTVSDDGFIRFRNDDRWKTNQQYI